MKPTLQISCYAPDGTSLGFRTIEAAERLIAAGAVKPAYGRKGHLRAIWLLQETGGNPIETQPRSGSRYSFMQRLDGGSRCWKHRRVDGRDERGAPVEARDAFQQVLKGCMIP
jgi:hypothetical protein